MDSQLLEPKRGYCKKVEIITQTAIFSRWNSKNLGRGCIFSATKRQNLPECVPLVKKFWTEASGPSIRMARIRIWPPPVLASGAQIRIWPPPVSASGPRIRIWPTPVSASAPRIRIRPPARIRIRPPTIKVEKTSTKQMNRRQDKNTAKRNHSLRIKEP